MLPDPLTVKAPSLTASTAVTVSHTDTYAVVQHDSGKVVRSGTFNGVTAGAPATLSISRSVSNENRPVKTDRVLVRLDVRGKLAATGQELNAFAYCVIGIPRGMIAGGANANVTGDMLVRALVGAMLVEPTGSTISATILNRIIAGEG